MSVKVIAELNPVSVTKTVVEVEPQSVSGIIAKLDTGFSEDHARVSLNGEIVRDFSVEAKDGDTLWIKFVFYGDGDQKKAGSDMKGLGFLVSFVGVMAIIFGGPGAWAIAGGIIIGVGVTTFLGGVYIYNRKDETPSLKDRKKPETDPSVRGGRNQTRQLGRIPVLFGRHRLYPDLAANPYTEIRNGAQYLVQLFCGGYRDCGIDTDSFKLGETFLLNFSRSKDINTILSGNDPLVEMEIIQDGRESALYPRCVNEQALNVVLKHEVDEGDGVRVDGAIIRDTPDKTDAINVDIFFYGGLGQYNSDNDLVSAQVTVLAFYKPKGAPDSDFTPLGMFNDFSNTIAGASLKTMRYQVTKTGLTPGPYTVKVERVTADSTNTKVTDSVYLGSIRAMKSARPIRKERQKDLTVIALRLRATERLGDVADSFNYIAASKLPVYTDGLSGPAQWSGSEATRNPASMLLYALQGRAAQQTVDDRDIDWPALERFYLWCEAHDYTCDACLAESVTASELFRMIGGTSRAEILRLDSRISVIQDIERGAPSQLFTPQNTVSYSETMLMGDVPDALSLRFIDAESGYAENEVTVYNTPDGNKAAEPDTIQETDLWGVTGSAQARRIGMYNYGCTKNRPFVHILEVDFEYLLCAKGTSPWRGAPRAGLPALKRAGERVPGFIRMNLSSWREGRNTASGSAGLTARFCWNR